MGAPFNPFAALVSPPPARLPKTTSQQLVVDGKRVEKSKHVRAEDRSIPELRRQRARAYYQARYQRERQDPAAMARRQAWYEANKVDVLLYKKRWDAAHADEMRAYKREWARRKYHESPESTEQRRQAQRDYYARNREKILARLAEKAAVKKAAKAQAKADAKAAAEALAFTQGAKR